MPDTESPPSNPRKRRAHRACDYCREHRIRCEYTEGAEAICKHCQDYNIPCEKVAPAPKDSRPRKRFTYKTQEELDHQGLEPGFLGGSSISQLAWLFCPPSFKGKLHALDVELDLYRGAICDSDEQGLLVGRSPVQTRKERLAAMSLHLAQERLAERVGAETVLHDLYDTASTKIITVFPVISKHESLLKDEPDAKFWERFIEHHHNSTPPTPLPGIVRVIHVALAALSRQVPHNIRQNVLATLHDLLLGGDFEKLCQLSTISSVQVLTLLSMSDELIGMGGRTPWLNLGTAIRMAQELALHRNVSLGLVPLAQKNRRARVWGACMCSDRWMALRHGQPLAIDLDMCDAPLPQDYPDHVREPSSGRWSPSFRFLSEYTKMSILLGRAYRLVCSPQGLLKAEDPSLLILQTEVDLWLAQLPKTWPYSPTLSTPAASDLINVFYITLEFTFVRPFLWPTTTIPAHITFRPSAQRWSSLVIRAEKATDWAETSEGAFYLDIWSNVVYSIVCCFFVHLKYFEQVRSETAKLYVERTDDVIQSWATQTNHPQRAKIAAMCHLLRQSAGPYAPTTSIDSILTPGGTLSDNWLEVIAGADFTLDVTS